MSRNLKISIVMILAAVVALLAAANAGGGDSPSAAARDPRADQLVRPDSQRLSESTDGKVTFVEFLDFECEACGALYPAIEELRALYGDQITFVVRYFPLHGNSEAAARAAEAAADQDAFEEMYDLLFVNQTQWSHSDSSQEDVFFGYAEQLGLDMDRFRMVYDDPATIEKIQRDQRDGEALGVAGTPTFFLNGEVVELSSFPDLLAQIDDALAG